MKKIDELEQAHSCLSRAQRDEPLFVLRANDELAPAIVRMWADMYRRNKGGIEEMTQEQLCKFAEAKRTASDMDRWKAEASKPKCEGCGGKGFVPVAVGRDLVTKCTMCQGRTP